MDIPLMSFKREAAAPAGAPPAALVSAEGVCATPANPPRGVTLGITECELVALAGATDRVEIGVDERGQRTAVLTYPTGDRMGIYRFTSGLLTVIDRVPEEPKPPPRRQQRSR
jgi:hypothetical protein